MTKATQSKISDLKTQLDTESKKLNRLRNPKSIQDQEKLIETLTEELRMLEAGKQISKLKPLAQLDTFKSIELYTLQVATGISNSLIVTGQAGVGKTKTVTTTIKTCGSVPNDRYVTISGTASAAGLYESLFKNRRKTVVVDDCDSVFKDADSVNILKAALDTYPVRTISKIARGHNYYDPEGMSETDMDLEYETSGKLPTSFNFVGQVIFISNIDESKFDKALLSRSLHVNVQLSNQELLDRMANILRDISPEISMESKTETLNYIAELVNNYETKHGLNIRTLIHGVNIRIANGETTMDMGGEQIPVWKLLINKYLVK